MEKVCFIIGAMDPGEIYLGKRENAFVMACDKGFSHLGGIKPDLVVGDFDSLGYEPEGYPVLYHVPEKDDTDTMMAVKEGFRRGFDTFVLYGCMGGRPDHEFANYQALSYITAHGGRGYMIGDGWNITHMVGQLEIEGPVGGDFSVFAFGERAAGVTIKGGKYPLENGTLTTYFPLGVSNSFKGENALIYCQEGGVLVMWQGDARQLIDKM